MIRLDGQVASVESRDLLAAGAVFGVNTIPAAAVTTRCLGTTGR